MRHLAPRGIQFATCIVFGQAPERVGIFDHHAADSCGDAFGGDVVMRRSNPAGSEDQIVTRAQAVDACHDRRIAIFHHPHFADANAVLGQGFTDELNVRVARATR